MLSRCACVLFAAAAACVANDHPDHPVSVYVSNLSGQPASGVPVVFSAPDGTLIADLQTNAAGLAAAAVESGGSITIIRTSQDGTPTNLTTIASVQPDDTLFVGYPPLSDLVGEFHVSFTAYPGAASYRAYSPCSPDDTTTSPATLLIYLACAPSSAELQVHALDDAGNVLGYVTATTTSFSADGLLSMPSSYAGFLTFGASFVNVPSSAEARFERRAPDESGYVARAPLAVAGTTASATVTGPATSHVMAVTQLDDATGALTKIQQQLAGDATTYTVDLAATLLPWVHPPTLDLASSSITIPVSTDNTSGDAPDGLTASISYMHGQTDIRWTITGPEATLTLPVLPSEFADLAPNATDTLSSYAAALDSDATDGWDDYRQRTWSVFGGPDTSGDVRVRASVSGDQL